MFEKYSENARKVMSHARQEAQKLKHDHIGTEHILLGLIEVKEGVAAEILKNREVDLVHAKEQIKTLVKTDTGQVECDKWPRTNHAQIVLNDAVKEARELKHNYIGTEHLLLGLLYENEGTGAKVIQNLGLKLSEIREDMLRLLNRAG